MRRRRNSEMTASNFNIFISLTACLSFILQLSHGFEVIQPQYRTVNSDGSVSISCEHTAGTDTTVEDVQLNGISLTNISARSLLCQKGMEHCKNVIMHQERPNKWLFILLNAGPEAMDMTYECEFTVKKKDLDYTQTGKRTMLRPGEEETMCEHQSPPQSFQLCWILIGLLALMSLYSCVITSFYIRLRVRNSAPENSTYVVMRNVPHQRNCPSDIYCL